MLFECRMYYKHAETLFYSSPIFKRGTVPKAFVAALIARVEFADGIFNPPDSSIETDFFSFFFFFFFFFFLVMKVNDITVFAHELLSELTELNPRVVEQGVTLLGTDGVCGV
jgi:hypothetical protein